MSNHRDAFISVTHIEALHSDQHADVSGLIESGNALDVADATFRLLVAGPSPLAVDGKSVGHGLPSRQVDLAELKAKLLAPGASDALRDAAWGELVRRSRQDGPAWVIGCVGVAMPGLVNIVSRVSRTAPPHLADDIASDVVAEFVAQLKRTDLDRPHVLERLLSWARKAAICTRGNPSRRPVPVDPATLPSALVVSTDTDPADLLADAVTQGVIDLDVARMIAVTRLDGVSLQDYAEAAGLPHWRLYKQRRAAEARLVAALRTGQLSANSGSPLSNRGA
ncbi:hypothetical protein ACGFNU_05810 [Spirillospora sp. NPDC048911]|uniref:hypothetical protein n=1 Tax=Spirillospora sp. NPDC048911 TaxID=3364527 RepID=UPI00371FE10A